MGYNTVFSVFKVFNVVTDSMETMKTMQTMRSVFSLGFSVSFEEFLLNIARHELIARERH